MIEIQAGSLAEKDYTGYKFGSIDTDKVEGDEVVSGTVITLTYVKDETDTKVTKYTVNHVVDGETTPRDSQEFTSTAWVNDDPAMIKIQRGSLAEKEYTGYKFGSIDTDKVEGDEVVSGTVITLTYVKDETATKEMTYTVEYYKDDDENPTDTDTVTKDVWVNDTTMPVDVDDINVTDKYTGYHFVETDPAQIPTEIEADGVIKVYYAISTFSYKVQHYYEVEVDEINPDGYKLDASLTDNISNIEYGTQISTFTKKEIDGYEYERVAGTPLTVTDVEANNVIRVYYKKKQIDYKVEYYFEKVDEEGYEIDNSLTETVTTAKFGDRISDYTDKAQTGFVFKEVKTTNSATGDEKLPLVISANANNNIIRVYYNRLSYAYSIEYYYEKDDSNDYDQDETLTVTGTAKYGSEISEYTPQEKTGFTFERTENNPLIITEKSDENVMKVFYGKPKVRVKSIGARDAHVGEIITYTIILENVGRVPGTIDVKNQLSDLVTYVDSSIEPEIADGLLTWKNITVEPGADGEVTITIDVRINDNAIGLEIVDTVIVPDQEDTIHTSNVFEIDSTIHEIKQGETGKDSVNVILVMDLSTSMNSKIRYFTECTHEHVFETHTHGHSGHTWTEETCPEGCIKTSTGKWGKYENTDQTRLQAARAAAQGFINNLYTNNPNSNATVTVITFNGSATILTFNGKTTATHNDYSELVTAVGNLATSTMGTNIRAALDKTYTKICGTNGLTTLYPNNSNVVIFLGDGEPSSGYSNNNSEGINARARDIDGTTGAGAGATIYAIGFGEEATDPDGNGYKILEVISSDGTVLTANDYTELAAAFTNIQEQIQDKSDQTDHGTLSFTASNTLVIDSDNPLRAILKDDDENETVLFVCTSIDDLDDYCITYNSSTRTLSWDLNEWNTGSVHTHVTSDNAFLSYYVAR